jgi:hypothetical protein
MGGVLDSEDATRRGRARKLGAALPTTRPKASATPEVTAVKVVHTLAWFSIEACMVYLLYSGLVGRSDRRPAIAGAVVAGEIAVFAGNGFRCPLTDVAERMGAESGSVTDIYLPAWFAHNLPAIHVPLVLAAVFLHTRNARRGACQPR